MGVSRILIKVLTIGLLGTLAWPPAAVCGGDVSAPPPPLRLVQDDGAGLTIEWRTPPVTPHQLGDGAWEFTVAGYDQSDEPGAPVLPVTRTLIALPAGRAVSLSILSSEVETQAAPGPLSSAPVPGGLVRMVDGTVIGGALVPADIPSPAPEQPVVLEELGTLRGVRLAQISFYPVLPGPEGLRVTHLVRVAIAWDGTPLSDGASPDSASAEDPVISQLRGLVLNPQDIVAPVRLPHPDQSQQTSAPMSETVFIEVSQPGVTRVTYADLQGTVLASRNPANLHMTLGSDPVDMRWVGDGDALFEPGEYLLFYAEPRFSRHVSYDAYRLAAESTAGPRMAGRSGAPTGLPAGTAWVERVIEQNHIYTPYRFLTRLPAGRDSDRWAWYEMRRPDVAHADFDFSVPAVDPTKNAEIIVWLIGYTDVLAKDPDHHVNFSLNGSPIGNIQWNGKQAITATLTASPGVLHSGANTLALSLPGISGVSVEGAWLDAFQVGYARSTTAAGSSVIFGPDPTPGSSQRAYTVALANAEARSIYDITDPLHPVRVTGFTVNSAAVTVGDPAGGGPARTIVTTESAILEPDAVRPGTEYAEPAGADYVVIAPANLAPALAPLLALRQGQGLATALIQTAAVYDNWGEGRPDPAAIHAFLQHAYDTWSPQPLYVVLVGDGSFDPREYKLDSTPTLLPVYFADVDPWTGETASDNRYVCVDGDDALPDLLIGRLPVKSVAEVASVVAKIDTYETDPWPGEWNDTILLVADDQDNAGDFAALSNAHTAAYVTPPFTTTSLYCPGTSAWNDDCSTADRQGIYGSILSRWNTGALFIQFTGHSSWHQWAAERFFHLDDATLLNNAGRDPIVVEMTCFTGAFHWPEATLDETLVVHSAGGAIATWGPTGLGVGTGHRYLADGFYQAVFTDDIGTLGQAVLAGKVALLNAAVYPDLLDTFGILGDPALRINRTLVPWPEQIYLPLSLRLY